MQYSDGTNIKLGDRVRFSNGESGSIVFSIDTGEYSDEFPQSDWTQLQRGVMIRTDSGALVHLDGSDKNEIVRL